MRNAKNAEHVARDARIPRHALIGTVNPVCADEVPRWSGGTEYHVTFDPVPGIATWAVDSLVTNQKPGVGEG